MLPPGIEFVERPATGRVFESTARVRLGDVTPAGLCRVDALARMLQDLSSDDTADAAHSTTDANDGRVWVLRRLAIRGDRRPRYRQDLRLSTWCSGIGPRWAERRTDIEWGDGSRLEAVALWACTDLETGAPVPLAAGFADVFGVSARGRKVSARLVLGEPETREGATWPLRASDFDLLGHVNNANYWSPTESALAGSGAKLELALIEFRGGVRPGESVRIVERQTEVVDGPIDERRTTIEQWWTVDGATRASVLVSLRS